MPNKHSVISFEAKWIMLKLQSLWLGAEYYLIAQINVQPTPKIQGLSSLIGLLHSRWTYKYKVRGGTLYCSVSLANFICCDMNEHSNHTFSLIELEGEKLTDSCRYCGDATSPKAKWCKFSSFVLPSSCTGISSSRLNVDDYKLLVNSGWRR